MSVPSPLGLLLHHSRSDLPPAREAILLTYNHDLGFFEKVALGLLRSTGARVSVIGDARVGHHDFYQIRRAGHTYLSGLARADGAFHPKLIVIAGDGYATVAIGSGNLSLSGWQGNDEIWGIYRSDRDAGSTVVPRVGEWLSRLSDSVPLSTGSTEALLRTSALVSCLAGTDTSAHLVDSIQGRILDQLPTGPVDELNVYAPFHDRASKALAALIDRFSPRNVRLGVQPGLTRLDGQDTARILEGRGELIEIPSSPFRHGKLIEWAIGDQRWALTGSPNVSMAALGRSVAEGGNVELAVIAPIDKSLMPQGVAKPVITLASHQGPPLPETVETAPALIRSAVVAPTGMVIHFWTPLDEPCEVEVSAIGSPPDEWRVIGTAPRGALDLQLDQHVFASSRIRLKFADGTRSSTIFVTNLSQVFRTGAQPTSRRLAPELDQVFSDPEAALQLFRTIDSIRAVGSGTTTSSAMSSGTSGASLTTSPVGDWHDYLERCSGYLGPTTVAVALGLPHHLFTASPSELGLRRDVDFDDELDDEAFIGELEDDDPTLSSSGTPLDESGRRRQSEKVRAKYRAFATKVVAEWAAADPIERLLALKIALYIAANDWPRGDSEWVGLVLDGVANLALDNPDAEYEVAAGSLAALALSITGREAARFERTIYTSRFERCVRNVSHLLVAADFERVAEYAKGLGGRFHADVDPVNVIDFAERIVQHNPLADARVHLEESGIESNLDGAVLELLRPVPEPMAPALKALAIAERSPRVVIRSRGTSSWATLLWSSPDLVVVRPGRPENSVWCVHYRFRPNESPGDFIREQGRLNPDRNVAQTLAGEPPLSISLRLLEEAGLTEFKPGGVEQ